MFAEGAVVCVVDVEIVLLFELLSYSFRDRGVVFLVGEFESEFQVFLFVGSLHLFVVS